MLSLSIQTQAICNLFLFAGVEKFEVGTFVKTKSCVIIACLLFFVACFLGLL